MNSVLSELFWSGCFSVGSCISRKGFSDANLRLENLADVSTECFSHHQGEMSAVEMSAVKTSAKNFSISSWYQRIPFLIIVLAGFPVISYYF